MVYKNNVAFKVPLAKNKFFAAVLAILFMVVLLVNYLDVFAATSYSSSTVVGQKGNFTLDNLNAVAAPNASGLNKAYDSAVDTDNHLLFVSDYNNNRVLVFQLDSSNDPLDRTADFVLGQNDFNSNTADLSQWQMSSPAGLAIDETSNRLFVADSANNRVMIFDYTTLSNGMNAAHVLGQTDFTSNATALSQNGFNNPIGLAYDPSDDTLWVADRENYRVLQFDVASIGDGENAVAVLGQADYLTASYSVSAANNFDKPWDLDVDVSGRRLFISAELASRVMIFDITAVADNEDAVHVIGAPTLTSAGSGTDQNSFLWSRGVAYDPTNDRLFVASRGEDRVMVFDVSSIADGEDAVNVLGADGFAPGQKSTDVAAAINDPGGLSVSDGKLYVTSVGIVSYDHSGNAVRIFEISSLTNGQTAVDIVGQSKADGSARFSGVSPDNRYPSAQGLSYPVEAVIDESGHRLFVADSGNDRIVVYNLDANNQLVDDTADAVIGQSSLLDDEWGITANRLNYPTGLAFDLARNWLFVADQSNNRVLVFDVTTITTNESAIYVLGQTGFTSDDWDLTQTNLNGPTDISYDTDNQRLFVVDNFNTRILVFDVTSISNGEPAVHVLGQTDFVSDNSDISATTLNYPTFIEYDRTDNWLFVGDDYGSRILVFDVSNVSDGMAASYVLGAPDFDTEGDYLNPDQDTVGEPRGMAIDEQNRLLFATDGSADRIMVFDISSISNGEPAVGVIGKADFTDNSTPAVSASSFVGEGNPAFDHTNNRLWVVDSDNHRMLSFDFVRITTTSLPSGNVGTAYTKSITSTNQQGSVSYSLAAGNLPPGVTISAGGSLSGTPTQTGTYNFTLEVQDDNGLIGTYRHSRSYSLIIDAADSDSDGISDDTENAGPNGGDANGDGTADAQQSTVASNYNPVTKAYSTVQSSSGTVKSFVVMDEKDLSTQNNDADFPVGLNSFQVEGIGVGDSVSVTVYYDQLYDTSMWTYMKYNPDDETYTNMDTAVTYNNAVVGGQTVTTVTYTLTDGGQYDEDGVANGTIIDPAGPAVMALANTGSSIIFPSLLGLFCLLSSLIIAKRNTDATFFVQQPSDRANSTR